ncbi:MAG TPA: SH3-like domain-containing protein [Sphingobium sp.]
MEGVHDMGGMLGYGMMPSERDDVPFHESWERLGYVFGMLGTDHKFFTIDAIRYAIERIPARHYITMPYFERMITAMASLFVEAGVIEKQDLERLAGGSFPLSALPSKGQAARREQRRLAVGQEVVVRYWPTGGHSRAPRYVQGKSGVVVGIGPTVPFASEAAQSPGDDVFLEPTYRVRFEACDLWPEVTDGTTVVVDLFQSYLDPSGPAVASRP